ncbi:MAG: hypothetical protein U0R51_08240 [Solirubrobacterales bacterium]
MVDSDRQVPTPSASAWSIDLEAIEGPVFIVHRRDEGAARAALVRHLVEIGAIPDTIRAERIVAAAPISSVGVVW